MFASAQKLKKADKLILSNLEKHIAYLSDDLLEGRRMGTRGEQLAYEYISKESICEKSDNALLIEET